MKFVPKTAEELEMEGLLPDDTYQAEVISVEEKSDKKGRDMLALKLGILTAEGSQRHIYDHISPHWGGFAVKFREFFDSMGQLAMYESGDIDVNLLVGQYVTAVVVGEKDGDYPAKNVVSAYVALDLSDVMMRKKEILAEANKEAAVPNGDLPFTFLAPLAPFIVGALMAAHLLT